MQLVSTSCFPIHVSGLSGPYLWALHSSSPSGMALPSAGPRPFPVSGQLRLLSPKLTLVHMHLRMRSAFSERDQVSEGKDLWSSPFYNSSAGVSIRGPNSH